MGRKNCYFCYGWMHSLGIFCKTQYGGGWWFDEFGPDFEGITSQMELSYAKTVLGRDVSFDDILVVVRKIFMLFRSTYAAQGRVREDEVFSKWVYSAGDSEWDTYEDIGSNGKHSPAAREGQRTTRMTRQLGKKLPRLSGFFIYDKFLCI